MKVLERRVQKISAGKFSTYMDWEKGWASLEQQLGGFPAKRHYQALSGLEFGTVVWEREWDSMAAMEAAYERLVVAPKSQELTEQDSGEIVLNEKIEFYFPVS